MTPTDSNPPTGPVIVFAPARSRGTLLANAFRDDYSFLFYEPLNPKVKHALFPGRGAGQANHLGHPENTYYFADLRFVHAEEVFPPELSTAWRTAAFDEVSVAHLRTYFEELLVRATSCGKRMILKLENPGIFAVALEVFPDATTVIASRDPRERLKSYWDQVLEYRNHYFFGRDLSWAARHPRTRRQLLSAIFSWRIGLRGIYETAFWLIEDLCQNQFNGADYQWDASTGVLHRVSPRAQSQVDVSEIFSAVSERIRDSYSPSAPGNQADLGPRGVRQGQTFMMVWRIAITLIRDYGLSLFRR